MREQVDGITKKKRVREILQLSHQFEHQFYERYVGKIVDGLVEVHKDGKIVVLTSNYISVVVEEQVESNKIVSVMIEKVDKDNKVYGKIIG